MAEPLTQSHGGARFAELRRLGLAPDQVIDFSASVNPYGPSPRVKAAMRRVPLERYPDPDCTELREALSARLDCPVEMILPGNGATELIHLMARCWSGTGRPVGIVPPTFGEYAAAATAVGAPVLLLPPSEASVSVIEREQPSLLYLCNPNNPTGELLSSDAVERMLQAMAPRPVVLDEAYLRFARDAWDARPLLDRHGHLVLLRSMTKDYGLTALRLGYVVAAERKIAELQALLPPWTVNGLAQAAGAAALNDEAYVERTIARVRQAKTGLVQGLRQLGLGVTEGTANFILAEVGSAPRVRLLLARSGLLVRDCSSFGLPRHIRIAVRRPGEHRRLIAGFAALVSRGELPCPRGSTIANIEE